MSQAKGIREVGYFDWVGGRRSGGSQRRLSRPLKAHTERRRST